MKNTKLLIAGLVAAFGIFSAAPAMAHSAPERHKVCKMDRHHHKSCHWVR